MAEPNQTDGATAPRHPVRITAAALALGLAVDLLFRRQPLGISFPIWSALSGAALLLAARGERIRPHRSAAALAGIILTLSGIVALRLEPLTVALSVLATLLLFALWLRSFAEGRLQRYGWLDFVASGIAVPLETVIRPWSTLAEALRRIGGDGAARSRGLALIRGGLLALPPLVIFTALLASADLVFEDLVEQAFAWLDLEWIRQLFEHAVLVAAGGLVSLGALATALRLTAPRPLIGEQQPLIRRFVGTIEWAVVLGSVDLLFAVFVLIQFRYLFGGEASLAQAGYSYAEYARRGFGEMVWAAIFGQALVLAVAHWGRTGTARARSASFALSAGLVAMLLVTLASALTRLLLYEQAYGFTRARTLGHVFIYWLAAVFVSLIVLLYRRQIRVYAPICVAATVGFVLSLGALNVDGFIAARNMDRFERTGDLDVHYLARLSDDALPELARQADADSPPELLALLACRRTRLEQQLQAETWQSYNLSRRRARSALRSIGELLRPYSVSSDGMRWLVHGPGIEQRVERLLCFGLWQD